MKKLHTPLQIHALRLQGFTLIEVMIVTAIVAILAAVALPAYNQYILRGKVTQAFSNLSGFAVSMQQYYQDNRSYVGACTAGTTAPLPSGGDFGYACSNLTATTFTITATGSAGTVVNGFAYTLDQNNVKATTATGSSGWPTNAACWVRDKQGDCN